MKKKLLSIILICFIIITTALPSGLGKVNAEEESTSSKTPIKGYTVLEDPYENPGEDSILVGVPGTYLADQKAALKRMNEIRKEACDKGYPDPRNKKRKLKKSDYVPIKWSSELEGFARIRACEGCVLNGHKRPGTNVSKTDPEDTYISNLYGYIECLAGSSSMSLVGGVNIWYGEKDIWVNGESGISGHYTSMINPDMVYVGLGGFVPDYGMGGQFNKCVCGRFMEATDEERFKDDSMAPKQKNVIQKISFKKENLFDPSLGIIANEYNLLPINILYYGEKAIFAVVRKAKVDDGYATVLDMDDYTYSSSNEKILKVNPDGTSTVKNTGKVKVKAVNDSTGKEYTISLKIKQFLKVPKVSASSPSKKKISVNMDTSKKDALNMSYYEIQTSTDKNFKKGVKKKKQKVSWIRWLDPQTNYTKSIKKLKSGKTYYVRVRCVYEDISYKNKNGDYTKRYSKWSKVKKIKVK
ncbi:MAG: hypothetical protein J5517_10290 [Eubacterium sp.]|nr:hypothetical protein [Eubacterium sp.]